jgi:hypothetical protein
MENKIRKADVYCASFPRMVNSDLHVIDTALSILKQEECATLTIELSEKYSDEEITTISYHLHDERVTLFITDDAKHSNEKLRHIGDGENEYLFLVDDDCVFGEGYMKLLMDGIDRLNAHVTLHGSILDIRPVKSYYRNRTVFRGLAELKSDYQVDIVGSCMSAFRRDFYKDLHLWYGECNNVSMDDLTISLKAKMNAIPMFVLAHPTGLVKHKIQYPGEHFVFDEYTSVIGADKVQTEFCNKYF